MYNCKYICRFLLFLLLCIFACLFSSCINNQKFNRINIQLHSWRYRDRDYFVYCNIRDFGRNKDARIVFYPVSEKKAFRFFTDEKNGFYIVCPKNSKLPTRKNTIYFFDEEVIYDLPKEFMFEKNENELSAEMDEFDLMIKIGRDSIVQVLPMPDGACPTDDRRPENGGGNTEIGVKMNGNMGENSREKNHNASLETPDAP